MNRIAIIRGIVVASALGGCQMLDSRWLDTDPAQAGTTCHSNAGTYHLPRRLITVTITQEGKGYGINVEKTGLNAPYVADRNETYCLDFLLSYLSDDRVGIQRTPDGLLQRVYTQADDKSKKIAQDVIQAGADLIASERANSLARSSVIRLKDTTGAAVTALAQFQFDPFVEREAREVNDALSQFNYCIYLDARNDAFAPPWSEQICRDIAAAGPKRSGGGRKSRGPSVVYKADPAYPRSGLAIFDPRPVPPELQARGILYRPELSHSLVVVRRPHKGARASEWHVVASDRIVVPNAAPAFIFQIERAIFVKAETDVQFSSGLIKNISVKKPSELLAAADLALAAAQIVTNIPAKALLILNNRTENTINLINTNAELINVLRQYKSDVNLEAFGPAAAQAQAGTGLILGPNPGRTRLEVCLAENPQNPERLRFCQEAVENGL